MNEKTYAFKFYNIKALRYTALSFSGLPFVFLLNTGVSVWIFMLILFAPIVLGGWLAFSKSKAEDVICIKDTYLDSSYFGQINYSDIVSISSALVYTKPNIKLKLNNGRKVIWALNFAGNMVHSKTDLETYLAFTAALEKQLKKVGDSTLFIKPALLPPEEKSTLLNLAKEELVTPSLVKQLEKVNQKNNTSRWVIPIGLAIALTSLIRTCGKDWLKSGEFNGPEMVKTSEKLFQRRTAEAKLILEKLVSQSGTYFLYSNDTTARLELLPDLDMDNLTGIDAFKYVTANESLNAFIEHPDSAVLNLYIADKGKNIKKLSKSILNMGDSTQTYLYFRAYDATLKISPRSPGNPTALKDSATARAFDIGTGIPIYDTLSLAKPISEAFPGMHMMLANAKFRPSTYKLYLAAKTGSGMTETVFRRAVRELNKQMNAVKVDTTTFKLTVFNKKPAS